MAFIGELSIILLATTLAGHVMNRIGLPGVIGQLLVGIALGPGLFGVLHSGTLIDEFAELGVIILMFIAGLESDLALLRKYLRPALLVAVLGIVLPIIFGSGAGLLAGMQEHTALLLGLVLAATSVSISVAVLKELKMLASRAGAVILGASVLDDVLTVLLVGVGLPLLTGAGATGDIALGWQLLEQAAFFVFLIVLVKWLAPLVIRLSERLLTPAAPLIMSVLLCLSVSFLAEVVGLSAVIGAFFAGIAIGETRVHEKVQRNVEAIGYAMFIPVFFVSIGLSVSFKGMGSVAVLVGTLVIIALLTKMIGGFAGARWAGLSRPDALVVGAGMVSRGEMALIILQLGSQQHLVNNVQYTALVLVIVLTTLISPLVLKWAARFTPDENDG